MALQGTRGAPAMMNVIGLCGYAATGKTTVASLLNTALPESTIISTSSKVRKMVEESGSEVNTPSMVAMHERLISEYGSSYTQLFFDGRSEFNGTVIFDSFRREVDVEYVRERSLRLSLLWVYASSHLSRSRMMARGRYDHDGDNFLSVRTREKRLGVESLKLLSAFSINNSESLEVLRGEIGRFLDVHWRSER